MLLPLSALPPDKQPPASIVPAQRKKGGSKNSSKGSSLVARGSRQGARHWAMQGIYHFLMNPQTATDIAALIIRTANDPHLLRLADETAPDETSTPAQTKRPPVDRKFFHELLQGVITHADTLTPQIEPLLDRTWPNVSPTIQAILLLAAYELRETPITPIQVILNEAVELARCYAAADAYRYVNGVLEPLAAAIRTDDYAAMKAAKQSGKPYRSSASHPKNHQ